MAEEEKVEQNEKIPVWQIIFDDIFLLFLLGVGVPLVIYTLWGIMDLTNVPVLK